MLFDFLKYVSPSWYFNLERKKPVWVNYHSLNESEQRLIEFDLLYKDKNSSLLDASYQAWQKGFIITDSHKTLNINQSAKNIIDNYRFLKKYYHGIWSWYVLMLRLLTFNNPITEIYGFIKSVKVQRRNISSETFSHEKGFHDFKYEVLKKEPLVSVIIPTLNRYGVLSDALKDLEKQDYPNFEVIIVDQSNPFKPDFYNEFKLNLRLFRQEEKALWLARNTAIKRSLAEYLLLFDDDSRVPTDWISSHLKCIEYFKADVSAGVSFSHIGAQIPLNYRFFRWGDQIDTGNALIKRSVFLKVGLFDRMFEKQRMGDGEFGLRVHLGGFINISNPYAYRLHLKIGEGGLRQMGSWDGFRPKNILAPRPIPSVLYLMRKYFGNRVAIFSLIIGVPPSMIPYRFKGNNRLLFFGSLLVVPFILIILIQVFRSWVKATKMLKEGPKIDWI